MDHPYDMLERLLAEAERGREVTKKIPRGLDGSFDTVTTTENTVEISAAQLRSLLVYIDMLCRDQSYGW